MRFLPVLTLSAVLLLPLGADAKLGSSLDSSIALMRQNKHYIVGATYWLKNGTIVAEAWNANTPDTGDWTSGQADKFCKMLVGNRRVKHRENDNGYIHVTYTDGTRAEYQRGTNASQFMGIEVYGPNYKDSEMYAGKYEKIEDWNDHPYKGPEW